ncbi:hypothetical protein BGZ59_009426 [Podila verticillata]|nr:hypothetical protein BGZ59_009426 [Podila verticillata]KFH63600.1 hypothetical protein MVEG_10294 [Podila verticillata NRRL 6337]
MATKLKAMSSLDTKPSTPIEVPELFARIADYLDRHTLVQMIQVCRKFHQVCIPLLWQTVNLRELDDDDYEDNDAPCPWEGDKGFRMGFLRHGRWIEHLHLIGIMIQDGDLEMIAENCTRLKSLDLTATNVTAETLQVLIHSDPYKTDPESKKRKRENDTGDDGDEESDGDDDHDNGDINIRMDKYRRKSLTETETEQEPDSQYESVGLDPSSSDQGGDDENAAGPIARPSSTISSSSRVFNNRIPVHRLSGTTRAAKFKGTPTRFPFQLEALVLNKCSQLTGNTLKVLQRLGPQLQRLSLDHVVELEDQSLIELMTHCPNLKFLSLRGCDVTNRFLIHLSENTTINGENGIEELKLDLTKITGAGLVQLAKGCKSHLAALSSIDNLGMIDEVLYAFIQESHLHSRESAIQLKLRTCIDNSVLTKINLAQLAESTDITDTALQALFRHATELQEIHLDGTHVQDESLIVLAQNYVRRLKRLGLGVPTSWAQHEQGLSTTSSSYQTLLSKDAVVRDISAHFVPGGLQILSLSGCELITNAGLRAIGRACVGLHSLSITNCHNLSLELFAGPWTSYALRILHMQDMVLMNEAGFEEEELERRRFPLPTRPLPKEDIKQVDPITWPVTMSHADMQMEAFGFGPSSSPSSPPPRRRTQQKQKKVNPTEQLAILRAFYTVLGKCRNLEDLDMSNIGFRIRVRDGLDLVLPALQQNLRAWHLTCHQPQVTLRNAELAWFGQYFGSGKDFFKGETGTGKPVSKLQTFSISDLALEDGDPDLYEWFMEQMLGFNMEYHN